MGHMAFKSLEISGILFFKISPIGNVIFVHAAFDKTCNAVVNRIFFVLKVGSCHRYMLLLLRLFWLALHVMLKLPV